jgi:hypothetical protein
MSFLPLFLGERGTVVSAIREIIPVRIVQIERKKKKVQIIIFKFQPAGNIIFKRSTKVIYTSKHKSMKSDINYYNMEAVIIPQ